MDEKYCRTAPPNLQTHLPDLSINSNACGADEVLYSYEKLQTGDALNE